jgi:hypothetical protein
MSNSTINDDEESCPIDTANEYLVGARMNMSNHSSWKAGRGKFVCVGLPGAIVLRTRQAAYRLCAYILTLAETLPDEEGNHTFEQVKHAIRNV